VGLCKPVVGAWQVMCAWASVSKFLPHNSATLQFQVLVSMQMDVEFKKEQSGPFFGGGGARAGGFGGGGGPSGVSTPKGGHAFQKNYSWYTEYKSCIYVRRNPIYGPGQPYTISKLSIYFRHSQG